VRVDPEQKSLSGKNTIRIMEVSYRASCRSLTRLTGDAYFAQARRAFQAITIPPLFTKLNHEISMKPNEIVELFLTANPSLKSENLNLSCGNNHLTAMGGWLNKSLQPVSCTALWRCRGQRREDHSDDIEWQIAVRSHKTSLRCSIGDIERTYI
jgi:hypothetical protein